MKKEQMQNLLTLIRDEQAKEEKVKAGLECVIEWNWWLDLTDGFYKAIRLLLPQQIYAELAYYLWECSGHWNCTINDKTYTYSTDAEFLQFLLDTNIITS